MASAYDIPVVVMLQPTYHFGGRFTQEMPTQKREALLSRQDLHATYFNPIYENIALRLKSMSQENEFYFIDGKSLMSSEHENGALGTFYDYVHFTSVGHKRVAEEFARILEKELGLLGKRQKP